MKFLSLIVCLALLVTCVPAFALTVAEKVTPQWTQKEGITMKTERRDNGTIGFTVTRYLDKAPQYENQPELTTRRVANLELRNTVESILQTIVAGKIKNNTAIYWFALSPQSIPNAHFSLSESPDYKDPAKEGAIIGGRIYEFDLSEFAAPLLQPDHP